MKIKKLDVFQKHQKSIAISTLRMSDVGARIMGGTTKQKAREFLKSIGFAEAKINQLADYEERY